MNDSVVNDPSAASPHGHGALTPTVAASHNVVSIPAEMAMSAEPESGTSISIATYLHAFRRQWVACVFIGGVVGAVTAATAFLLVPTSYTATAMLKMSSQEQQLAFADERGRPSDFSIYKATQQTLIKSQFVLLGALRDPELSRYARAMDPIDPEGWLASRLQVRYPNHAEILTISLSMENGGHAQALVNGVVSAYLKEVVDVERSQVQERLQKLDTIYSEQESEVRRRRSSLRQLADQLGTADPDALSMKQQIELQRFGDLRRELMRLEFELKAKSRELLTKKSIVESELGSKIMDLELQFQLAEDPVAAPIMQAIDQVQSLIADTQSKLRSAPSEAYRQRYQMQIQSLEEQLQQRVAQFSELAAARREFEVASLESEVQVLGQQIEELRVEVDDARSRAENLGGDTIDIEMSRTEIAHLEGLLSEIRIERDRLRIEQRRGNRTVLLQEAQKPKGDQFGKRVKMAAASGMLGFAFPIVLITFLESLRGKLNGVSDTDPVVGGRILGSLPIVPMKRMRASGSSSPRLRQCQLALREAVDTTTAMLLCRCEQVNARVVLVTSAMRGEGKTTVATRLAGSMARHGFNTLLVDFDLQSPLLHRLFGVAGDAGVTDLILGEAEVSEVCQPTSTPRLSVLPAGKRHSEVAPLLAGGAIPMMFDQLRDDYQYIVIDAGPLLSRADARLMAQHVDGAVLSVLRDVSRADKLREASTVLEILGCYSLGTVVTCGSVPSGGPSSGSRRRERSSSPVSKKRLDAAKPNESQPAGSDKGQER